MKPIFVEGNLYRTTVKMTVEDVGQDIPIGSIATCISVPSDDEQLVMVSIDGLINYLPQDVFVSAVKWDSYDSLNYMYEED